MATPHLEQILATLPASPGVYLFKNAAGEILYVGKAVSLRQRVRSYFRGTPPSPKVRQLVSQVADIEYHVTGSELEALLLECNLIKKHRPKYNVRLRDDKQYPYIKVSLQEPWPRVYLTRKVLDDGARYFGPYTDSRSVYRTLDLLNKLFPYRTCHIAITGQEPRPCLQYHIKRCLGPCIGAVSPEEYRAVIDQVCLFLEGKHDQVLAQLRARMEEAAERLEFERAAFLRDQIRAVEKVSERQRVISTTFKNQDVIALARADGQACVEVFFIRGGKLIGAEHFALEGTQDEEAQTILAQFVAQFYANAPEVPDEILVPTELEQVEIIEQYLRDRRGTKVTVTVPRQGDQADLIALATANAMEALAQMRLRWLGDERNLHEALVELAEHLDLEGPPRRIECYDISTIHGTAAVGAMVVFENGQPRPQHYRRFRIKTVPQADDYAMLQEVLRRRFRRATQLPLTPAGETAEYPWQRLPDLVIIDGGRGQLNAALAVLQELGLERLDCVALAKRHEEIYSPKFPEPILLPRSSAALRLVQQIRDETHRLAVTYHRQVRTRAGLRSLLDEVPGIGPKRKAALLRHFGSLEAIRAASVEELAAVPGMDRRTAQRLKEAL